MSEYFELSFLVEKNKHAKENIMVCLYEFFSLCEGDNNFADHTYTLFAHKNILLSCYEEDKTNFYQFYISFSECIFHKNLLEKELQPLTQFVKKFFDVCSEVKIVFCSYEMNSYYISQLKDLKDVNANFLLNFPLVYISNQLDNTTQLQVNLKAQDIFVD